jgi:glycosyltransferase involved in cell wall biosynthesis
MPARDEDTDRTPSAVELISVVVPMHDEALVCEVFFARIVPVLESLDAAYEIVCVNDGSGDDTLERLRAARADNPRIKIIDLSRNFGKELALTAGLDHASGDAVIPIDADLQDPPEVIPELVEKWREGNDMVLAIRSDRSSDSLAKRASAALFYRLIGRVGEVPIPADAGDFRLMDRRVVEVLRTLPERTRFMKGLFAWLGFRQARVLYSRPPRAAGESKWRFWALWNFAVEGIVSFTTLPLRVWTYFGLLVAAAALAYMAFIIVRTLILGIDVPGYASIIVLILFFSGLNMIGLGILGEYLGRVFIEVKRRPLYLVREAFGFDDGVAPTPGGRERRQRPPAASAVAGDDE